MLERKQQFSEIIYFSSPNYLTVTVMKAMSTSLVLVVTAIVILVTAVVVLAIFFNVIPLVMGLTEAKGLCQLDGATTCSSMGTLPPTWNVQNKQVRQNDGTTKPMSCGQLLQDMDCGCTGTDNKQFECKNLK